MKKTMPNIGESRIIKKFLLLPKEIQNNKRWFCVCKIYQVYTAKYNIYIGTYYKWDDIAWVDDESNSN